jgi:hypothetical protein
MPQPHGFKELSQRDITDQSQDLSSRETSPERLQKLRNRAYMFTKEYNKGKNSMTPEMEMNHNQAQQERWDNNHQAAIQEIINERDGRTGGEIQLGNQEGLRGAGPRNTSDYFDDNEELHRSDWARLERKLNKVKKAFNTLQYIKNGEGDYSEAILNAAIRKRERTGERLDKYLKDVTSSRLGKYYQAFRYYRNNCNSNEEVYLNAVYEKSPATAEIDDNADSFREGLRSTLDIIETYKDHAPND